ncbi:MAG: RES family NAD+ phosphorylase [Bacteroidetes bacterium]|nr:RES family NAD+ phosphorylase [Bacteroidota bacterium]
MKFDSYFLIPNWAEQYEDEYHESLNPAFVLDEVGKAILELGYISAIPLGSLSLYRARQHKLKVEVSNAKTLGSPPSQFAKANRMSPAGISMFYGALDVETCKAEVIEVTRKGRVRNLERQELYNVQALC